MAGWGMEEATMIAINKVDFTQSPFVAIAQHAQGRVLYCGGHFANRDQMPVFVFPDGIPAIGQAVRFWIKREERLSKNQFRSDGRGQAPVQGAEPYGTRTVIRVKPATGPFTGPTLPHLVYLPRPKGHAGGWKGGHWDTKVLGTPWVFEWRNSCTGGKWWEWFTLALVEPGATISFHRQGGTGAGIIDEMILVSAP